MPLQDGINLHNAAWLFIYWGQNKMTNILCMTSLNAINILEFIKLCF